MPTKDFLQNATPVKTDFLQNATPADEVPPPVPKAPIPSGLTGPSSPNFAGGALNIGEAGKGAIKGLGHTLYTLGAPGSYLVEKLGLINQQTPEQKAQQEQMFEPTNTAQKVGHGIEQVGEFLVPGGAEERAATKLATVAPRLGKLLPKVITSAVSSGAVNAAQGGSPITGALAGAGGAVAAKGMKALAPTLTGIAQGLEAPYAKTGNAILNETKGVLPGSIRKSARGVLDKLNPELNAAADRASVKPNPVRALLPAPAEEIPLHPSPAPREPLARPMAFHAESQNAPSSINADIESPHYLSGSEHPELSGQIPTSQGVWVRPSNVPAAPIPSTIPNPSVSLAGARGTAQNYVSKAFAQNEPKFYKGTKGLARQVSTDLEGNPIPENVTPRQALDIKRGVGNAVSKAKWRPGYSDPFTGAKKAVYGELDRAFEGAVPEAGPLNQRISALIPATEKPKNFFFGHALGPGVGATLGGVGGYRREGIPGAFTGAAEGALAGYAVPTALNTAARIGFSPATQKLVRPLVGSALQLDREKKKENK